ncbi:hypothetical protein BDA99DRAFT_560313 [Phascolomyces articulosus]|uniref:F-box domain-containing protein n=1 Tax=Phascolomyces articulosus TaxID=60185 RepID=A0AAD5JZ34_9FUNG|nr:hypothetical protein BDA99DRAFT_560313 [Phascolomyces articulosus]
METHIHDNYLNEPSSLRIPLSSNEQTISAAVNNDEKEMNVETQIDFVSALPFDIVSCVLPHLPKLQLLECMKVNKTWRLQVLECHEAWQELEISVSDGTLNNPLFFNVTQIQANHVRRLELVDPGDQWIKIHSVIKSIQLPSTNLFIESLKKISPSLKRLQVAIRVSVEETLVPTIWSTCTGLTHLAIFIGRMADDTDNSSIELPVLPDLIHLSLHLHYTDNIPGPFNDISTILRACPNLEYYCNGNEQYPVTMLNKIYQHCPKLRRLAWKDFPLGAKAWDNTLPKSPVASRRSGLSEVTMWLSLDDIIHGSRVYLFLDHSKDTLEKLAIHGPSTTARSSPVELLHWNIFSEFSAHKLHTLTFKRLKLNTNIMVSILRQCQALRAVTFVTMREIEDPIFDALLDLIYLEKLHITNGCRRLTPDGLTTFLASIVTPPLISTSSRKTQQRNYMDDSIINDTPTHLPVISSLKDVQLDSHLITSSSITALSNVNSIEKLHLSVNRDYTIEKQLDEMPKKLTNLVEVKMFTISACTDIFLSNLSYAKRLKRVELLAIGQASDQGIMELVDKCENLKYIAVRVCPMITQDAISYAQQRNICVRFAELTDA